MNQFLHPPGLSSYDGYFQSLLAVAGVLFGLAFTGLVFVLQSGLTSFAYSRRMFLELYVHFGRSLLFSLAYMTIVPFAVLYMSSWPLMLSAVYYAFTLYFIKSTLDYYSQQGYIHTLNSTAFVPGHYGPFRAYFRRIRNLGFASIVVMLVVLLIVLGYPVMISYFESGSLLMTTKGIFYSTLILLVYSLLRTTNFIPQFFSITGEELKAQSSDVKREDLKTVDYKTERLALVRYLEDRGVHTVGQTNPEAFLDGSVHTNLFTDRDGEEAWFNIWIDVGNPTNVEVRDEVCNFASRFFSLLESSQADINSFVLSFHIKIRDQPKSRNIFIRTSRTELERTRRSNSDPVRLILSLNNVLFDDLFRDLPHDGI